MPAKVASVTDETILRPFIYADLAGAMKLLHVRGCWTGLKER